MSIHVRAEIRVTVGNHVHSTTIEGVTDDMAVRLLRYVEQAAEAEKANATGGGRTNKGMAAERLRATRISRKLTQGGLAGLLGIPQSNVSQMEKGKRPITDKTAARLAEALRVDANVFLPDERQP